MSVRNCRRNPKRLGVLAELPVRRGGIEWDVGGETFLIGPGDSVYLDSRIPHRARALDGAAEALVVVTPWQVRGGDGDG